MRIRRLAEPDVEYECVLAKRNTVAWQQWCESVYAVGIQ